MNGFIQSRYLLLFFLYCFLGWVWESSYVSVRKRKWVNRGFLYGPWLPIYGSGALVVLVITLPVCRNMGLVFVTGMIGATILEYATGAVMEKMFQMRYWDYSNAPLNLNGHICLGASLGWGCFSVAMVKFINPPVVRAIFRIPVPAADMISFILTILFVVDTTKSVQSAYDLKAFLQKLSEHHPTKLREYLHQLETAVQIRKDRDLRRLVSVLSRNPSAMSHKHQAVFRELITLIKKQNKKF